MKHKSLYLHTPHSFCRTEIRICKCDLEGFNSQFKNSEKYVILNDCIIEEEKIEGQHAW